MGVFYETIPEREFDWIRKQKVFWVATAPLSAGGHVNVSPKGGPYFDVADERTYAALDPGPLRRGTDALRVTEMQLLLPGAQRLRQRDDKPSARAREWESHDPVQCV